MAGPLPEWNLTGWNRRVHRRFHTMSEGSQPRGSRNLRAERVTTSCGECRRRKQKCDQRQPCGNCARRFPQPVCEYKLIKRSSAPGVSTLPTFTVTLRPDRYSETEIPGTRSALLEASPPPWAKSRGGEVVRWSGVDITTTYPSTNMGSPSSWWNSPWTDQPGSMAPGNLPQCDKDCKIHSDAIHDAVNLLMHHINIPNKFLGDGDGEGEWSPMSTDEVLAWTQNATTPNPWPIGGAVSELRHLPMAATRQNGELLRIYLKLLCRFKASLDGNPEPSNPFVKQYVPYAIQDPLLLQIVLYTSACFLNETGHVPRTLVMAHKGQAIRMLNEHLRSDTSQTSDAAIAGVIQLIVDEWYWGETQDLRAHLRGLREMIRIRGGFSSLGMNGFLAKNAIAHDVSIALAHEITPFLQNGPEFEFSDLAAVPFRMAHNSPYVGGLPSFETCAESLGLHPATASILDDMRFLLNTVLSLPAEPTPQQLQKVKTTSQWMHNRILNLNPLSGDSRPSSPASQPAAQFESRSSTPSSSSRSGSLAQGMGAGASSEPSQSRRSSYGGRQSSVSSGAETLCDDDVAMEPEQSTSQSQAPGSPQTSGPKPDPMYQVVRMAALVYSRAIMTQQPISKTCTPSEFLQIWTTTWRVPLTTWKSAVGIFNWIMLSITPCCHKTPHERFVKSMLMISILTLGMENWKVSMDAARAGLRLQLWLRDEGNHSRGDEKGKGVGPQGGGKVVSKHGYHQPEW